MMHYLYSLLAILNAMSPYILLGFLVAGLLHAFVSMSAMSRHLGGRGLKPVVKAALFGIPLPLCSCGVLPTAVALRRQGASKGASTSFLVATPQTGVDSIAATYSLLGLPFAILRPMAALVGAMVCGYAVDRTDDSAEEVMTVQSEEKAERKSLWNKLLDALKYGYVDMVASVGKWLVVGLLVAAAITVFVPDDLFAGLAAYPLLAMIAVVIVAIPMYICATGSIPIAMSLMLKGLTPGIAFVMLMAGPAANFASLIILGKSHGVKATAIYVATITLTAIGFGLLIDLVLPQSWFVLPGAHSVHSHEGVSVFQICCSVVLMVLLIAAPFFANHNHQHISDMEAKSFVIKVQGMACVHCKNRVEEAACKVSGVESATVDLSEATLTVCGDADRDAVAEAVTLAGYTCEC